MKKLLISMAAIALTFTATVTLAQWNNHQEQQRNTLMQLYKHNAYGSGVHSDATGRPFEYRTYDSQQTVPGNVPVRPDAYGLEVGMDAYGRPVRAYPR